METTGEVLGPARAARDLELVDDAGQAHRHLALVMVSNGPYALGRPPLNFETVLAALRVRISARELNSRLSRRQTSHQRERKPGGGRR